jgi:hypothetical protein
MMAKAVIDGLEAVEVEEHQREVLAGACARCNRLGNPVFQQAAVGQARQAVVQRQVMQLLVGLAERTHQHGGARGQARVHHRQQQRDGQQRHRRQPDHRRQPVVVDAALDHADAGRIETRRFHAGVMHGNDRESHQDSGADPLELGNSRLAGAQREGQPQRGDGRDDGNGERGSEADRFVLDGREHPQRMHAHVMHAADAQAHQQAAAQQVAHGECLAGDDEQREGGDRDGRKQGEQGDAEVVAEPDRQAVGQHADEMHGPDADAHRHRAAGKPAEAGASFRMRDAARQVEGRVRRHHGDKNGKKDQATVVTAG